MRAGRLYRMPAVLAFQLLVGPIVIHRLTRPLAEALLGVSPMVPGALEGLTQAWLRTMASAGQTGRPV